MSKLLPRAAQFDAGRALRGRFPRSELATWDLPTKRDPVALLESQNVTRLPKLVPIRMQRMVESPFAFYRGAALVMATDLAAGPSTGLLVRVCGDAHVANFGVFGARDGELVFDVNDFDETFTAPWEWDVKRLATSLVIAAQHANLSKKTQESAARAAARSYRRTMVKLAGLNAVARFYAQISAQDVLDLLSRTNKSAAKRTGKQLSKARANTSGRALRKLGVTGADGEWAIAEQPPLIDRLPALEFDRARELTEAYLRTVPPDVVALLDQFSFADGVLKVVGVGSVGTRCFLVLLTDADGAPLFLQIKEAGRSVLDPSRAQAALRGGGKRVVAGQRIMQASSDPFLGWFRAPADGETEIGGTGSYYVRLFRNMKGSLDLEHIDAQTLTGYGRLCAAALARAHAQSGIAPTIAGYLGDSSSDNSADRALAEFAVRYADLNQADFDLQVAANGTKAAPVTSA